MVTGFGSERERHDRALIKQYTQAGIDPVTKDKIVILPIFNVHDRDNIVKNRNVKVLRSDYTKHTLSVRKIYAAFDIGPNKEIIDPRPFLYIGDPSTAYGGKNKKTRLAHLIKGLNENAYYIDKLDSIKTDPCIFVDDNIDNCVPHNIIVNEEDAIKHQVQQVIRDSNINIQQTNREKIEVTDKVRKAIEVNTTNKDVSIMEYLILNGEIPTSKDCLDDIEFKYLGVTKKMTKQGARYIASVKSQNLGTYMHPVDAARAVNSFVIENGLPYPVNNIPGFLELEFVNRYVQKSLADYELWQLSNELSKRLMPDDMKF